MGILQNNINEAAGNLIPVQALLESSNSMTTLTGLEIIVENEINAFSTAANDLHLFVSVLQSLGTQNNQNINSNLLTSKNKFIY